MNDVPQFDLYGALGLPTTATLDEIEAAFRHAAKRDHPDTSADPDGATHRMQRINVARDWLADPERRHRYDHVRGVGRTAAAIPEVDPLGDWPDVRPSSSTASVAQSSVMPAIALLAVTAILTIALAGIGSSYLTVAAFALAVVLFVFAIMVTILRWLR